MLPKTQWDTEAPYAYGREKPQYGEENSGGPLVAQPTTGPRSNCCATSTAPRQRPSTARSGSAGSGFERLPDPCGEIAHAEGFGDKLDPVLEHPVMCNDVRGVSRREEDLEPGCSACKRRARSRPFISGITTSVTSRWMGPRWAPAMSTALPGEPDDSTVYPSCSRTRLHRASVMARLRPGGWFRVRRSRAGQKAPARTPTPPGRNAADRRRTTRRGQAHCAPR